MNEDAVMAGEDSGALISVYSERSRGAWFFWEPEQFAAPGVISENAFLRLFGNSRRMEGCECERDNGSNMLQALHFLNGKAIQARVQNPGGRAAQLVGRKLSDTERVTELYLWSVARHPNDAELKLGTAI